MKRAISLLILGSIAATLVAGCSGGKTDDAASKPIEASADNKGSKADTVQAKE
ncbi:MAG: hypothetical protein JNM85_08225 [Chthonomonas sp.]|nr:hypothetical protein [Chthonomonas sp.]